MGCDPPGPDSCGCGILAPLDPATIPEDGTPGASTTPVLVAGKTPPEDWSVGSGRTAAPLWSVPITPLDSGTIPEVGAPGASTAPVLVAGKTPPEDWPIGSGTTASPLWLVLINSGEGEAPGGKDCWSPDG